VDTALAILRRSGIPRAGRHVKTLIKGDRMKDRIREQVQEIFANASGQDFQRIARNLREIWLEYDPKSIGSIKKEDREKQEISGAPVKVLRSIGEETGALIHEDVKGHLPLLKLLWDEYGREGRIVSSVALGRLEIKKPAVVIPEIKTMCRSCITWEDCDQLAMRALEPAVRRNPERWLPELESWLADEDKWVQRAGVTVVGRLPMKHPSYTERCLAMLPPLLTAEDQDVRRAVSFAIRLCARGEIAPVREFLASRIPPDDPAATWVLCDAIRGMTTKYLPEFKSLLPQYQDWAEDPDVDPRDARSIHSAITKLQAA